MTSFLRALLVASLTAFLMTPISGQALTTSSYTQSSTVYVVNSFTLGGATENWTVPFGVSSIDAIAVGGGGGGAWDGGNGGGGGELRTITSYSVTAGNVLSALVGNGGAGGNWNAGTVATAGSATRLRNGGTDFLVANGGNAGIGWSNAENYAAGGTGGSGGTGLQGGRGGVNRYQQNEGIGGNGSNGPTSTLATNTTTYYGGGGGGGSCWGSINSGTFAGTSGGLGGGGGGAGHTQYVGSPAGTSGTANTGGGGGAGAACDGGTTNGVNQRTNGGNGGSGIVVVRYVLTAPYSLDLDTASDLGSSNSDNITSSTTPSISGVAIGGSSIQLFVNGSSSGSSCTANSSTGAWTCTTGSLTAGVKTIVARATIGGSSVDSSSLSITIDSTAPTITPAAAISVAENQTSIATIACSETCTLAMISGVDSAAVTFTPATGVLVFKVAPDFEAPNDVGADRTYLLSIRGTDVAGNSTTVNYTVTITNSNESGSISAPTVSGTINKGITTSITVTLNVSGRVGFFVGGKRISTCKAINTSGSYPNTSATCTWKPAVTGRQVLTATLTPTDNTFSSSTSARTEVFVQKRTNTR